jgi:mono/diheme cytochrome c family protein
MFETLQLSFLSGSKRLFVCLIVVVLTGGCNDKDRPALVASANQKANWPSSFGFGHPATEEVVAKLHIDVMPDGHGLPAGSGNVTEGANIYQVKCASCHGENGTEGPANKLVGAIGDTTKAKTIGNYWPYATTLFDYIRRAMPYNMPGSLSNQEVYSLTAFLLNKNKIVDTTVVMNAASLPKVKMPAQKLFVIDDRRGGREVR